MPSTPATPSLPPAASPCSTGRPSRTASAPRARQARTSAPRRTPPSTSTVQLPRSAAAISGSTSNVAGAPSSCRPPWLDTTTPPAPASLARTASEAVSTPLTSTGSELIERSQATTDQSSAASNSAAACPPGEEKPVPVRLAGATPDGSRKPLRRSRTRRPSRGASAVSTSASKPAASARSTSRRVVVRSRKQYTCSHSGAEAAAAMSSNVRPAKVLTTSGAPARAVATSPSGSASVW